MQYLKIFLPLLAFLILESCSDNSVTLTNQGTATYKQILSASTDSFMIQLFVYGCDSLTSGYNDVYFKVKRNSIEQTKGNVKLFPKMWMTPRFMHSTPVSPRFQYDNTSGYYKGYAIFNMVTSPPGIVWYSVITYTDEDSVSHVADSIPTYTSFHREKQWMFFLDSSAQITYMISLVKPFTPVKGMNDLWVIVHKTRDQLLSHDQIFDAQMSGCVYELDSLNRSSGNISPISGNDGIFRGRINLPYSGAWKVCDTIYINGHNITDYPPLPEFYFELQ